VYIAIAITPEGARERRATTTTKERQNTGTQNVTRHDFKITTKP
jgi:hypothetical protein